MDSTIVKIEGLDEIARWKGIYNEIEELTTKSMNGELSFTDVFAHKVERIAPSAMDFLRLGDLYIHNIVPNIQKTFKKLRAKGYEIGFITGNFEPAIFILADYLNVGREFVFANRAEFDENASPDGRQGNFKKFDPQSVLAKGDGKLVTLSEFKKKDQPKYLYYVGDSTGDMRSKEIVTAFIGFGGVVERTQVKENAKFFIYDMLEILNIVA